ncbi:MAG: HAD family hydrolase [Massilia sp.]
MPSRSSLPAWPKAILFDLDDTLWPIGPVIVQAEQALYGWLGEHAPAVARAHSIDSLRAARMALLAAEPAFHLDLAALRRAALHAAFEAAGEDSARLDAAMDLFLAARNAVTPYPDVLPVLERLGRHALLGSISNGNADLRAIGLDHHFRVSLAAHQLGVAKPDPAIFHAACAALDVAPHEALYVGDDPRLDVEGARNAGLRAVWLRRESGPGAAAVPDGVPADATADAVCADFGALLDWLLAHHAAPPASPPRQTAQRRSERA